MSDTEKNNDTNGDVHTPPPNIDEIHADSDDDNSVTANLYYVNDTLNTSASNASRKPTKNGILNELQNTLSIACYEAANKKDMKADELMIKCYNELFSNVTRVGFSEQLIRGEGHFANLFERVPAEEHGENSNNTNSASASCKLKIKDMLVGDNASIWFIEDLFTAKSLCYSACNSSTKISPKTFTHKRFKVTERNIKKIGAKFSLLIKNKDQHTPEVDNESGKTYEDYFIQALEDAREIMPDQDNNKSCPLMSGAMAFYLCSPYSCCNVLSFSK